MLFSRPIDEPRPPGSPRFDAFSPKLKRRVSLYSVGAFDQWVLLEADPEIDCFCERPYWVTFGERRLLVDFWVRGVGADYGVLLVGGTAGEGASALAAGDSVRPALRTISAIDLLAKAQLIANWRMILPYLTANGSFVTAGLLAEITDLLATPLALEDLEQRLVSTYERMLVRTGVFCLLHRGRVVAPALAYEALGPRTCFGGAGWS